MPHYIEAHETQRQARKHPTQEHKYDCSEDVPYEQWARGRDMDVFACFRWGQRFVNGRQTCRREEISTRAQLRSGERPVHGCSMGEGS